MLITEKSLHFVKVQNKIAGEKKDKFKFNAIIIRDDFFKL